MAKKKTYKTVVLKMKDSVAPKIKSRGMHLGMQMVEMRPKVFEIDSEEFKPGGLMKSKQFKFYMEEVEVEDMDKYKVGDYTDDLKTKMSDVEKRAAMVSAAKVAEKEEDVKTALETIEKTKVELEEREKVVTSREKDVVDAMADVEKREKVLEAS